MMACAPATVTARMSSQYTTDPRLPQFCVGEESPCRVDALMGDAGNDLTASAAENYSADNLLRRTGEDTGD